MLRILAEGQGRHYTLPAMHEALEERGWTTTGLRPRNVVANLLSKAAATHGNRVKRADRGVYYWSEAATSTTELANSEVADHVDDEQQTTAEVVTM